jgi:hypothetical protein
MLSILFLFLFIGMVMIIDGIYREELKHLKNNKQIQYKFIPRTTYDDMLFHKHTTPQYETIFKDNVDSRAAGRLL